MTLQVHLLHWRLSLTSAMEIRSGGCTLGLLRLEGTSVYLKSNFLLKAGPPMRWQQVVQSFIQSRSKNLQGRRQHSLSGQSVLMPDCPHSEIVSCLPVMQHYEDPHYVFYNFLVVMERLWLGLPKAISSLGRTNSIPSASPPTASAPDPNQPGSSLINIFLVGQVPNWSECLTSAEWREIIPALDWLVVLPST